MSITGLAGHATRSALIVEDDDVIAHLMQCLLQWEGYAVSRAATRREVEDYLARNPPPDLVTLDGVLSDSTGFELLPLMRAAPGWKDVPVLLVTGSSVDEHELAAALASGVVAYLGKPFSVRELRTRLARLCDGSPVAHPATGRPRSTLTSAPGRC
jgi:DNA-binding response OmpR family regulator